MKVVILAGGFGTRLSEITDIIPKPMVEIGGVPILIHIMNIYAAKGFKDFIIPIGYKAQYIKNYFLNLPYNSNDFSINLNNGKIKKITNNKYDWNVTLVDTGIHTMTGGRVYKLKKFLKDETFMLTYGDGLANIDIKKLLSFHKKNKKLVTITTVRPSARFGHVELKENKVISFKEKPQINTGWINGGFFVMQRTFLNYLNSDQEILERDPLEKISKINQLVAYKHEGFWQCMDTLRDKIYLEELWKKNKAPWKL